MIRRYDPSLPPILGDEDRLLQVFHNLVRNALDAMDRGGRLTLTTRVSLNPLFGKIDVGTGQRSMVEVQVTDEGAGIPADVHARIFDPFFTTKDKGLGLGLSICHRILEEHRGAIQVDSAEGRGTSVTCFLPIAKSEPLAPLRPPPARTGLTAIATVKARILVADDEDSLRWVLEKGLRQAGYEVTAVKDGTAAVRAFETEPFDVVFLDVRMPGIDGLTALGRLREIHS